MKNNTIMFVREFYSDEEKTLAQGLMYKYGDNRERDYLRNALNPHVRKLVRTEYLNSDYEIVKEER